MEYVPGYPDLQPGDIGYFYRAQWCYFFCAFFCTVGNWPAFFGFIAIMFIFSAYWVSKRRGELVSENQLTRFLSREAAFLYNNFLILAILAVVFLFTHYPILSELFTGEKGFVGPPVYERALAPLFAMLLLLMGVAP